MSEAPRDPMRAAQANMRPATIKRFYRTVDVREATGGQHALTLDGRGARTPGRNPACGEEPGAHARRSRPNGNGSARRSIRPTCR